MPDSPQDILSQDYFKDIICYLKHANMKIHAITLVRQVSGMTIQESRSWVEQLTNKKPVAFRRLHGFD